MTYIGFPICSLLFMLILIIIYYSKKRVEYTENKIFTWLLIINIIGLILEILCYPAVINIEKNYFFWMFILKSYVVYTFTWVLLFNMYVLLITNKKYLEQDFNKKQCIKKYLKIFLIPYLVYVSIIYVLKLNVFYDSPKMYTYGLCINIMFVILAILVFIWIIKLILRFTSLKNKSAKQYIFIIVAIIFIGLIGATVQIIDKSILILTTMHSAIMLLMYFTIENPDVKVIEQINYLKTKAESEVKAKNKFLRNMSHEIATPINKAKGINSFNIGSVKNLEEVKENAIMVDHMLDELNEKSQSIINNIKLESGSIKINNDAYKPIELFASIKNLVIKDIKFKEKGLKYTKKIDSDLPELLYGDSEKLKEVVMQLLNNAIKYTKKGTITLTVECHNSKKKCLLDIKVKDTGIGINEKNYKNLFKAFSRIDVDDNITIGGLGLGLANAKLIIESLNGKIELSESKVGKGSTFSIEIEQEIIKGKK